jgi:hypothetical protein
VVWSLQANYRRAAVAVHDRRNECSGIDKWFVAAEPETVNHIPGVAMLTEFDSSREPT